MSAKSNAFKNASGLNCLSSCSRCCTKPDIMASPIEMLPLALTIIKSGAENSIFEVLSKKSKTCALLTEANTDKTKGQCAAYQDRPVICRLFGFAKTNGKNEAKFSGCKLIKDNYPAQVTQIEQSLELLSQAPNLSFWADKVRELEPFLAQVMPINEALKIILEKVLMERECLAINGTDLNE